MRLSFFLPVVLVLMSTIFSCADQHAQPGRINQRSTIMDTKRHADSLWVSKTTIDTLYRYYDSLQVVASAAVRFRDSILNVPVVPIPASVSGSIDWMWGNHDSPKRIECYAYAVDGDGLPKLRGGATANQCVRNAISAARAGNPSLAINWLRAGQCHNPEAQAELANHAGEAVQYAVSKYGHLVP